MEIKSNWLTSVEAANEAERQLLELDLMILDSHGWSPRLVEYFRNIFIGRACLYLDLETAMQIVDECMESTNTYAENHCLSKESK